MTTRVLGIFKLLRRKCVPTVLFIIYSYHQQLPIDQNSNTLWTNIIIYFLLCSSIYTLNKYTYQGLNYQKVVSPLIMHMAINMTKFYLPDEILSYVTNILVLNIHQTFTHRGRTTRICFDELVDNYWFS